MWALRVWGFACTDDLGETFFINFLAWPGWFVGNQGFIITMATMLGRPKGIWEDQKDLEDQMIFIFGEGGPKTIL